MRWQSQARPAGGVAYSHRIPDLLLGNVDFATIDLCPMKRESAACATWKSCTLSLT